MKMQQVMAGRRSMVCNLSQCEVITWLSSAPSEDHRETDLLIISVVPVSVGPARCGASVNVVLGREVTGRGTVDVWRDGSEQHVPLHRTLDLS